MSTPTQPLIMVIRHAEKPADSPPPHGVNTDGDHDDESLSVRGWQRAGALACLFDPARGPLQSPALATPRTIFATGVGKHSNSERPQETVAPLAARLNVTPDTGYLKGDETDMVNAALAQAGPVLIAWQHEAIPAIANQILGNSTTVPQTWPGDRFDLVWVFTPSSNGYTFTQVPQLLLVDDSADPIS